MPEGRRGKGRYAARLLTGGDSGFAYDTSMSYAQNLWIYFILLFGIIIVPGMDMAFVIANSIARGRAYGLAATFGIMLGGIVHTLFGALAVGVITHLPPLLVTLMLLVGSLYLAWIGWTLLRSSITFHDAAGDNRSGMARVFWQGTMTCLLNPKAYIFVLAVYPQFIRPQYGAVWWQALVMGILTFLTQFGIYGGLGLAAARSRALLTANPEATRWIGRAAGGLFLAVAAVTAWGALPR